VCQLFVLCLVSYTDTTRLHVLVVCYTDTTRSPFSSALIYLETMAQSSAHDLTNDPFQPGRLTD